MLSFKVLSFCFLATFVSASGGGGGGGGEWGTATLGDVYGGLGLGLNSGYGGGLGSGLGVGLGSGLGGSLGLGGSGVLLSGLSGNGPTSAAVQSRRTVEVLPLSLPQEPIVPQVIDVEPSIQPVQVIFRTISSPVQVQQIHTPGQPGQVESTRSEDEPHRVLHEVTRPVIQEVREVIQPYRRVVQEVRPVLEEVHTLVAKGEGRRSLQDLGGYGGEGLGLGLGLGSGKGYKKAKGAKAARA